MAGAPPNQGRIVGINRTSLWTAWKQVRRELRSATLRDVVDHLEYDVDPDVWINRSLYHIRQGTYEPQTPWRYTIAKSKGFSRRMTMPAIPDVVLLRAIGAYLQRKLKRREHPHVYFERRELAKASELAEKEANSQRQLDGLLGKWNLGPSTADYQSHSKRRQRAWLRYNQYRKLLIFKRVYPFIVTTDVTNFFDSILHDKLGECFHSIAAPPRMIGLLFFLLERLSIREAFSDSPRLGLPVDEFDCSRQFAHLLLYSHDDRMVATVGNDAYVRWMDDQNVGVTSYAEGLRVLATVGDSLSRLHLTANAGKSRILSLAEARRHFHLDLNDQLDRIEFALHQPKPSTRRIAQMTREAWKVAKRHEDSGEWDKILKRIYRFAALGKVRGLRRRAKKDLLRYPSLTPRIADYMRTTGSSSEYIQFASSIWSDEKQIYPDINAIVFERLLRLEPERTERPQLLAIAFEILDLKWTPPGAELCCAIAPLVLLRYGDGRSARRLRTFVERRLDTGPYAGIRACAIVYSSFGPDHYRHIRSEAARMFRNPLAETVRLVDRIRSFDSVPSSIKQRVHTNFDPVAGRPFLDMRTVLTARLLRLNRRKGVANWLDQKCIGLDASALSDFDRDLLRRLLL